MFSNRHSSRIQAAGIYKMVAIFGDTQWLFDQVSRQKAPWATGFRGQYCTSATPEQPH
jgi:hypothetical protein